LAGAKHDAVVNQRNGNSAKTVLTDEKQLHIEVPWEQDCSL